MKLTQKITARLVLIFFCITANALNCANEQQAVISQKTNTQISIPNKIKKLIITKGSPILFAFTYLYFLAPEEVKKTFREQITLPNIVKNFAKEYFCSLITTVVHELGHAISGKYLAQSPIDINLGGSLENTTLFTSQYLKIKGIDPRKGSCLLTFDQNFSKEQKLKYAAIYMSGGISGALTIILLNLIINLIEKKQINSETVFMNSILFEQLANAFIPINNSSDASKVWKNFFNTSDETIQKASQIQFLLYVLFETYLSHKQTESLDATDLDKIFITILNANISGFLRFHI